MNKKVRTLALRLAAIYLLSQLFVAGAYTGLGFAYSMERYFDSKAFITAVPLGTFLFVLTVLVAYLLWGQAKAIADDAENKPRVRDSDDEYMTADLLVSVMVGVGLLIIGLGFSGFIQAGLSLVSHWMENGLEKNSSDQVRHLVLPFMLHLAQMIFAVTLIVGRRGWTRLIYNIRYAGTLK